MTSSLKFGTSGLRGLASDLIGPETVRHTLAFASYLLAKGEIGGGDSVLVGRDLRASSPDIAASVQAGLIHAGLTPIDCGALPTPALALYAQRQKAPAIMVTGSHIPADRNGLKFYRAAGEITKADESGIIKELETVAGISLPSGSSSPIPDALAQYKQRYLDFLPANCFAGLNIGVFEHSSVGRDLMIELLKAGGAEVRALGREDHFVPIDTEALGQADIERARDWVASFGLDALVSTDGDADRPLIADNIGRFIRGDLIGLLTASYLGADVVVTPVTSNSALEAAGLFERVVRTRVGSPFVIAGMAEAAREGASRIVGFEANGGVLLGSNFPTGGGELTALPTRDAILPILAVLLAASGAGLSLADLVGRLPVRVARSDRLEHVSPERTAGLLEKLADRDFAANYFAEVGEIADLSTLDGMRFTLTSGEIVHYRASGNAPEMRCYIEAGSETRAEALLVWGLMAAAKQVRD